MTPLCSSRSHSCLLRTFGAMAARRTRLRLTSVHTCEQLRGMAWQVSAWQHNYLQMRAEIDRAGAMVADWEVDAA